MKRLTVMKIEQFFELIDVTLVIKSRGYGYWYACGENVEVKSGNLVYSEWGQGSTPDEALSNYASVVSGKKIVVNPWTEGRKEFVVPVLTR